MKNIVNWLADPPTTRINNLLEASSSLTNGRSTIVAGSSTHLRAMRPNERGCSIGCSSTEDGRFVPTPNRPPISASPAHVAQSVLRNAIRFAWSLLLRFAN